MVGFGLFEPFFNRILGNDLTVGLTLRKQCVYTYFYGYFVTGAPLRRLFWATLLTSFLVRGNQMLK